jgi:hypothetical protein
MLVAGKAKEYNKNTQHAKNLENHIALDAFEHQLKMELGDKSYNPILILLEKQKAENEQPRTTGWRPSLEVGGVEVELLEHALDIGDDILDVHYPSGAAVLHHVQSLHARRRRLLLGPRSTSQEGLREVSAGYVRLACAYTTDSLPAGPKTEQAMPSKAEQRSAGAEPGHGIAAASSSPAAASSDSADPRATYAAPKFDVPKRSEGGKARDGSELSRSIMPSTQQDANQCNNASLLPRSDLKHRYLEGDNPWPQHDDP